MGTQRRGIDFDALDGEPAFVFFLLVSPANVSGPPHQGPWRGFRVCSRTTRSKRSSSKQIQPRKSSPPSKRPSAIFLLRTSAAPFPSCSFSNPAVLLGLVAAALSPSHPPAASRTRPTPSLQRLRLSAPAPAKPHAGGCNCASGWSSCCAPSSSRSSSALLPARRIRLAVDGEAEIARWPFTRSWTCRTAPATNGPLAPCSTNSSANSATCWPFCPRAIKWQCSLFAQRPHAPFAGNRDYLAERIAELAPTQEATDLRTALQAAAQRFDQESALAAHELFLFTDLAEHNWDQLDDSVPSFAGTAHLYRRPAHPDQIECLRRAGRGPELDARGRRQSHLANRNRAQRGGHNAGPFCRWPARTPPERGSRSAGHDSSST